MHHLYVSFLGTWKGPQKICPCIMHIVEVENRFRDFLFFFLRKQFQRRYSKVRKKKIIDSPIQLYNMIFMYIPEMNIQLNITQLDITKEWFYIVMISLVSCSCSCTHSESIINRETLKTHGMQPHNVRLQLYVNHSSLPFHSIKL